MIIDEKANRNARFFEDEPGFSDDYARAVHDMVDRTGTTHAPWTLVEANDKYYARVHVLQSICSQLEKNL